MSENTLDTLLQEDRAFPPPPEFAGRAHVSDREVYRRADADPEGYWAGWAEELHWFRKWDRVLEWDPPYARWFVGGELNAAYNCLDRHLEGPAAPRRRSSGRASPETGRATPTRSCTGRSAAPPTRCWRWGCAAATVWPSTSR